MKPYSEYSAEELAMENLFIRWIRFPDDPSMKGFWENWMIKYPGMIETVDKARELVLTASDWKPESLTNQEVNSLWGRIRSSLEIIDESEPHNKPVVKFMGKKIGMKGLVVLFMSATFLFFLVYFFFLIV
jgi:hypothetical protein